MVIGCKFNTQLVIQFKICLLHTTNSYKIQEIMQKSWKKQCLYRPEPCANNISTLTDTEAYEEEM